MSAVSSTSPALGGAPGKSVFRDGDPTNDFYGVALASNGTPIVGELAAPIAGAGGGGGGNSVNSDVFPLVPWIFNKEVSGGGGGAGGGLIQVVTRTLEMGPQGSVRVNGGSGGRGESTNFLNGVGGAGGGGSGGMLMIQAARVDLSEAEGEAFAARGGEGGPGFDFETIGDNSGGMGGPGLIQLHIGDPAKPTSPEGGRPRRPECTGREAAAAAAAGSMAALRCSEEVRSQAPSASRCVVASLLMIMRRAAMAEGWFSPDGA